jgi:small subunit ribosomal protein S17
MENKKVNNKKLEGTVTSDKMQKTIVVEIERFKQHPRYKKTLKIRARFKAHDENNEAKKGDFVLIEECRPLSKDKKWKLLSVIKKAVVENADASVEEVENK